MKKIMLDKNYEINIKNNQIHIINYKEILSLTDNQISIKLVSSKIIIQGINLIINSLDEKEILISGNLTKIEFLE